MARKLEELQKQYNSAAQQLKNMRGGRGGGNRSRDKQYFVKQIESVNYAFNRKYNRRTKFDYGSVYSLRNKNICKAWLFGKQQSCCSGKSGSNQSKRKVHRLA